MELFTRGGTMKDKLIGFLGLGVAVLILVICFMHYQKKALKAEKNALYEDVLRYRKSLEEKEKQNEVLLQAKKEYEQFKQELANDDSDNLNVVVPTYVLNRMHTD